MKDKISFIVVLVGIFLAATPFRNDLAKVQMDFGFITLTLLNLVYISFSTLALSVYIYALDYVRYGFKRLDGWRIFKYLQITANTLYLIAIISPIIYFFVWVIIRFIRSIPIEAIKSANFLSYVAILLSILSIISTIIASWKQYKEQRIIQEEKLDETAAEATSEVNRFIEEKHWRYLIIETFRSLELNIRKKLIELGYNIQRLSISRCINILHHLEVLTSEEVSLLYFARNLRNEVIHTTAEFSEEDALEVNDIINKILPKLETLGTGGRVFEREVIYSLVGKDKLFLKHHLFPEFRIKNFTFDAKGEGPNYDYYIEIKLTRNKQAVLKAINQIKSIAPQNSRKLIVIPSTIEISQTVAQDDLRILFFDVNKKRFVNQDEIYNWIYGDN